MHYVGIDVGKKASHFHVTDDRGQLVSKGTIDSRAECFAELIAEVEKLQEGVEVAIESGNATFTFARAMEAAGANVFVVHPLDNAMIARSRRKTDAIDAKTLAEQRRRSLLPPHPVHIPTEAEEDLRHLVTAREALVDDRTALANRIQAILARYGVFTSKGRLKSSLAWKRLRESFGPLRSADRLIAQQCVRIALQLNNEIARLEKEMNRLVAKHWPAERDLLQTIPGVGPVTCCSVLAWGNEISRFRTARQFASYVGLAPAVRISGASRRDGGTRGGGNKHLGRAFVQAALNFVQRAQEPHELHAWYLKVRGRRGWKKARVALGRKLASVAFGVLKHRQAYDPRHLAKKSETPAA